MQSNHTEIRAGPAARRDISRRQQVRASALPGRDSEALSRMFGEQAYSRSTVFEKESTGRHLEGTSMPMVSEIVSSEGQETSSGPKRYSAQSADISGYRWASGYNGASAFSAVEVEKQLKEQQFGNKKASELARNYQAWKLISF